jgi:hypothetical protein
MRPEVKGKPDCILAGDRRQKRTVLVVIGLIGGTISA